VALGSWRCFERAGSIDLIQERKAAERARPWSIGKLTGSGLVSVTTTEISSGVKINGLLKHFFLVRPADHTEMVEGLLDDALLLIRAWIEPAWPLAIGRFSDGQTALFLPKTNSLNYNRA
jgi:hypothetical protein